MTSVSRSESNDEAPEGTGTGVPAQAEGAKAPRAPRRTSTTSASSASPSETSTGRSTAAKASTSKTTAARSAAARSAAAKKAAATRAANKAAAAAAASEADAANGASEGATGGAAKPAASRRTGASRAASATAATARGEAAKSARTTRSAAAKQTGAASKSDARTRAATAKRQSQRTAAAVTTETTAAERPRKATDAAPEAASSAATIVPNPIAEAAVVEEAEAIVNDEADEETQDRVPVAEAAAVAAAAATVIEVAQAEEPAAGEAASAEAPPAEASELDASTPEASEREPADRQADLAVAVIPAPAKKASRKKRTLRVARPAPPDSAERVLLVDSLVKRFGDNTAVDRISLEVRAGSFFGVVGPNGAGKTTTLSMITGLLRPDEGSVRIHGIDAWADPNAAKRATGVLPDRLRLFDRLTGAQLLHYSGVLRGLDSRTVRERSAALIAAFGLDDAVDRLVADYSAGMTKKIALACAMIHSPRLLVLDEPFESVDPVSAANLTEILETYVAGGGTVVLSSHGMDLIERVCDSAAIVVGGRVLASGTLDEVRQGQTLEDRFVELAGGRKAAEGLEWLHSFSD